MIKRAASHHKDKILRLLERNEAMNCPMIAQLERFGFEKDFQDVWLYEEEQSIITIIMRHFNQMYLHAEQPNADYEEIASFSCFLGVDTIWGPNEPLSQLSVYLKNFQLEPSRHMVLANDSHLVDTSNTSFAVPEDSDELAEMIYKDEDFRRFYTSLDEIRKGIKRRIEMGQCRYRVVKIDGIIAAQAYTTLETARYATIGGVITPEGYRNRGLAGEVVSAISRDIQKDGKIPNLFFRNEAAGRVYKRLGFMDAGAYGLLKRQE